MNKLQIVLVGQQCYQIVRGNCSVSHYERNDLIDIKINAVRGNLFTTYSKVPADTGASYIRYWRQIR